MSLSKPKVQAPTPAPAPAMTGAEELKLGGADPARGAAGAVGRLKLRTPPKA